MSAGREEEELADALDALVRADPGRREAMLGEIAEREPVRAAGLRALLAVLPDPELGVGSDTRETPDEPAVGDTIGGCVLESVLGRGGIGTVFAARQLEPPRAVAVKILRSERARPRDVARFRAEATALARLEHPAIARLYASGIEPRGARAIPFIVMERVPDARDIIAWSRDACADARTVAVQFATVCDALQHGHNRGIVHSDLKPSNILVDGDGRPRVIDFGIARLASSPESDAQEPQRGALVGTPAYMAPEQIGVVDGGADGGAEADIDARVDIHAIGLILYEALLGRRAYELPRELPSARAVAAHPALAGKAPPAPRSVDSRVSADLSAIVMKAMAIDRARRYSSMGALADDLRAFAEGRPVGARADSRLERLARTARRHPIAVGSLALAVLSLAASLVLSVGALDAARRRSVAAEMVTAMAAASVGDLREATAALARMDPSPDPILKGMVERLLDDAAAEPVAPAIGHLVGGALSPDGARVAVGGDGGQIAIVDLASGAIARARIGEKSVWATVFSRDGARVYAGDWQGAIVEIDLTALGADPASWPPTLEARPIALLGALVRGLAVSRDDGRLLVLSSPGVLSTIDLADGTVASSPSAAANGMARSLAWTGEGRAFVAAGSFTLAAFDVPEKGAPVRADLAWLAPLASRSVAVALSRDGAQLAVGEASGRVTVVDAASGEPVMSAETGNDVWSIDFSPTRERLAVATRGGRVHELGIPSQGGRGDAPRASHGTLSHDPGWFAAFRSDGSLVATMGLKVVRFGPSRGWATRLEAFPRGLPRAFAVVGRDGPSPALRAIAADGSVWDLEVATGSWTPRAHGIAAPAGTMAFSDDGARVACWSDGGLEILSVADGARVNAAVMPRGRRELAWDPAGDELMLVSEGEVHIVALDGSVRATGRVDPSANGHDALYAARRAPLVFTRFSTRSLLSVDGSGAIVARTAETAGAVRIWRIDGRWFLPDLSGAIRVSHRGDVQALDRVIDDAAAMLVGHTDVVHTLALAPDGRMLASAGMDTRIRFWDIERAERLATAPLCERPVRLLEWLDGGRALLAVDAAGEVFLLDSVPRRTRLSRAAHASMQSPAHASMQSPAHASMQSPAHASTR